jgi:hypothetical protein
MKILKIGTVFSGIGSPEQALSRLNIPHTIEFACDNGERIIDYDHAKEFKKVRGLKTSKEKKDYVDALYLKKTNQTQIEPFRPEEQMNYPPDVRSQIPHIDWFHLSYTPLLPSHIPNYV